MIYLTGDLHRNYGFSYFLENTKKLTKDDYIIILGDFGGIWNGIDDEEDKAFLDLFLDFEFTTLFIDGNHENFNALNSYEITKWNGGNVHKINEKLIHLMRGQVFTIDNKKFFTFGGATSIDKELRIENITWWKEEETNYDEINTALENLEKENYKVDYILTHTCPKTIVMNVIYSNEEIYYELNSSIEKFLDEVLLITKYKKWFFGHFHKEMKIKEYRMEILYNNMIKIDKK